MPLCIALAVLAAMLGASLGVVLFAACVLGGRND